MASHRLQAAFAVALFLPAALPAAPYLVKELHPGLSEKPQDVILWGIVSGPDGVTYFSASDPAHGTELWRSNGTPDGTYRVTDICAGRCSSSPSFLRIFHGQIFFAADDGFAGKELWVTDGTPGSEHRVRDLCAGPCSSSPSYFEEAGGSLFFFAMIGPRLQLWKTDGTRDGTVRLKFICNTFDNPYGLCDPYPGLFPAGDRTFFFDEGSGQDAELWVTDGTTAGTCPFKEVVANGPVPDGIYLTVAPGPGFAWLWTQDGLWRSDGTAAGTYRLKTLSELFNDPDAAFGTYQIIVWNKLFFGITSGGMIRSDGTPEGTFRISKPSGFVSNIVALDDGILLSVEDDLYGPTSFWRSQGTEETTVQVRDLGPFSLESHLVSLGDRAIFSRVVESNTPPELWSTDGTAAGTHRLHLPAGPPDLDNLFSGGGRAWFLRFKDYWDATDLWTSDGSEAGTRRVKDFRVVPGSSGPLAQTAMGKKLLFSAQTGVDSAPLFLTDGTAVGTHVFRDDASWASDFSRLGHRILFTAAEPSESSYFSLWQTDVNTGRSSQVTPGFFRFSSAVVFGGSVYWESGELMKTDGTASGTVLIKDINPYLVDTGLHHLCVGEASDPVPGQVLRGRLLLAADDGTHGRELWMTDGTNRGTQLFLDLNPLRSPDVPRGCDDDPRPQRTDTGLSSNPEGFVKLGPIAFFSATDGRTGRELWRTDGTPQRTRRVADLRPGRLGSAPHSLVAFHGQVYFFASSQGTGEELWRTDGTGRGTTLVRDLSLDGSPSWGRDLMVAGDRLYFVVYNETTGAELWVSGGDAASTALVSDLNSGPANASPRSLTDIDGILVFAADDGLTGLEPWRSDGTPAGTFRLTDLSPGLDSSSPGPFTRVQQILITGADDGAHGREPWALPLDDIVPP